MNKDNYLDFLDNIEKHIEMIFVESIVPSSDLLNRFRQLETPKQLLILINILKPIKDKQSDYLFFLFSLFFENFTQLDFYVTLHSEELMPFLKECFVSFCLTDAKLTDQKH